MANIDAPFGFRPINNTKGVTMTTNRYYVTGTNNALFIGDPVVVNGEADADGVPAVVRATSGSSGYVTGVVVGVESETDESLVYRANSTNRYVIVADDPYQEFEVQADEDIVSGDIGATVNFIFDTAGSTVTGFSGAEIDSSNIGTGDQFVIEGVTKRLSRNELGTNFTVVRGRFNLHKKRHTTGV